jgi:DNA polymerase-3 subunit alpha
MSFVHLHVHSQYSLLEATVRIKKLVERAKADGQAAIALTDNGNLYGAAEFYFSCFEAGVKPIIGLDAYLAPQSRLARGEDRDANSGPLRRLVLLAMNLDGYQELCQLATIGFREGFYYKPRIDFEVLQRHSANLICLTGDHRGEVHQALQKGGKPAGRESLTRLKDLFGDRLYVELNRQGLNGQAEAEKELIELAGELAIPLVAANNVHYLDREDQLAQETLICIGSNRTLHDEGRFRLGSDEFYLKSSAEMAELFSDQPDALANTLVIADRCNVKFKLKDEKGRVIYHLPRFPTEAGESLPEFIRRKTLEGLEIRFTEAAAKGEAVPEEKKPDYFKRLDYELDVIEKMGFTSYFLIVQDFINWAKEQGIPVGPGRGSGAGSLVAFSLRITDLDPVPYRLLFERFLNPERISMPDFDIDFCQDRRQEVIEYVTKKYGFDNVSQIITYGKLQARAAIRDVGRVLGMTYAEVDQVSKLMPDKLGITLAEAIETEPRIRELMELNPQVATLMELAQKIEGLVRHAGIHAAGVIIGDSELIRYAPLSKGADGETVLQYDMKWAEKMGLIKFDFLGLKTLTHIQNALNLVEANRGLKIAPQSIPIQDAVIYQLMSRGDTAGVFQFEGDGITDAVKKIKPKCFEDITAINALYRPGPMDQIPEYTARMHGESKVEYLFPELEEILEETYGIIVYQEQVMAIASRIGGYSLGESDLLRRAMGKKIPAEMAQQKERFLQGAREKGFDSGKSEQLFEWMAEFANYGFNKSHAAAYCVVSAQTAWIKAKYPVEFYAALLSTEMGNTDNVVKYIKDARSRGIDVRPPHINRSEWKFTVTGDVIEYGLGAIKGVGESAVEALVDARKATAQGRFDDLDHFFNSIDVRRVNKKVIECLIKANAFDGLGAHQAQLMEQFERYLERAESVRHEREVGQGSLFALLESGDVDERSAEKVRLEATEPWPRAVKLASEKEVLGFYLSDHPLTAFERVFRAWTTCEVRGLNEQPNLKRVVLAGLVSEYREIINKKGARMAFCQLEDLTGQIELIVFSDAFKQHENDLKSDQPILVGGQLKREGDSAKIIVDRVAALDSALGKTKRLVMRIEPGMKAHLQGLAALLKRHPGGTLVDLEIEAPEVDQVVTLTVEDPVGVAASRELFESLHGLFGRTDFVGLKTERPKTQAESVGEAMR